MLRRPSLQVAAAILVLELVVVGGPHLASWMQHARDGTFHPRPVAPAFGADTVVTSSPSPPPPSPLPDYGPVPAHVAVFWAAADSRAAWLTAFDWTGRPVGTLHLADVQSASPDGQTLWSQGSFIDARGHILATPQLPTGAFKWAFGSDGICGWDGGLWIYRMGASAARRVRSLPGGGGEVAGCSFQRDLAALLTGDPGGPSDLWWIRLHDGAILGHHTYAAGAVGSIVVSPDLSYFAENYIGYPHPQPGPNLTRLRRSSDGALVATRTDLVTAFSGDSHEIVTANFNEGPVGVFTLGGYKIWTASVDDAGTYAAPTGDLFLVQQWLADANAFQLLIIHGDGTTSPVPGPPLSSALRPGG